MSYEWEKKQVTSSDIQNHIHRISTEIKRILNVLRDGNFAKAEDRKYWEVKVTKLNSELSAYEEMAKPAKIKRAK